MTLMVAESLAAQQPAFGPLTVEEGAPLHKDHAGADGLEVAGRLTLETGGGGVLDTFVLRYHELLGFGQAAAASDGRSVLSLKTVASLPAQSNLVGERRANVALVGLARLGVSSWSSGWPASGGRRGAGTWASRRTSQPTRPRSTSRWAFG
ncbi:MAG TPA: hypothetical protein VM198_07675 [Longimicrobiales bacterium]|nr:hypothetical protein [Longimicrobiales bacterium]